MDSSVVFTYGTMGSSKSANLLMQRYELLQKGFNVLTMKSAIDTRDGVGVIKSRTGLECSAVIFSQGELLTDKLLVARPQIIIVDESQFLSAKQVDELKRYSLEHKVSVFCYGLKTDFKSELFPGSKRLLEIADDVREIQSFCECGKHASVNARLIDGKVVVQGEQVQIGGNESYKAMCFDCWDKAVAKEAPKWQSVFIPNEAIIQTYDSVSMVKMPENSEFAGYVFYHSNKLLKKATVTSEMTDDNTVIGKRMLYTNVSEVVLKKGEEKVTRPYSEISSVIHNAKKEDFLTKATKKATTYWSNFERTKGGNENEKG